ncbi:MAG: flagellar basal body rod protein FlgC [Actinomycetota bacterium]
MGMYAALGISATGLSAQRLRMDVVANNLANADSTLGPGQAYRRKAVVMTTAPEGAAFSLPSAAPSGANALRGVAVTGIVEDQSPLRKVYQPGDPNADDKGFVTKPNVNSVTEMIDMIAATRSYQANVTAFDATKQMALETLKVLR